MYLNYLVRNIFLFFSIIIIITSYIYSSYQYSGNKIIFFLFFLSIHLYLIISFFFSDLFFDKVLSTFLWLGFYLTIFFKIAFNIIQIKEGEGNFRFLPEQFDKVLIYAIVAFLGFTASSLFHKFFIQFKKLESKNIFKILEFYNRYKYMILFSFFLLIVSINFCNFKFEIYQKGLISLTSLNPLLSIIFKFFIIFGLTAISTLLIDYENKSKKKITFLILLIFYFEVTLTNTVLLSRSYIFLGGFMLLATLISYKINKDNYYNSFLLNIIFFSFTFLINVQVIETIRDNKYFDKNFIINEIKKETTIDLSKKIKEKEEAIEKRSIDNKKFYNRIKKIFFLIQNRFVGFEALAIVTSSNNQSNATFWDAFGEEINFNGNASYYSTTLMNKKDQTMEKKSERQISVYLPGVIAFFSYYGSLIFLFFAVFLIHLLSGFIEKSALLLSYNCKVFSSFVGYILAYRLIHFGYVPKNSYMLLTAIFISILGIFVISKLIQRYY